MLRQKHLPVLLGLLLLISLPYLFGFVLAGNQWSFGGFLLNPIDGHTYLAKMYQGFEGAWRFQLPYTSEKSEGAYLFLYYLALGHLARVTGLPLILVFHLARLVGATVMAAGLIRFYEQTLPFNGPVPNDRKPVSDQQPALRNAIVLGLFGSGLGWIVVFAGLMPSDIWVAETYPFLSAYVNPHFPLGLGMLLWLLVMNLRAMQKPEKTKLPRQLWMAVLGLLISIVQPFGVVILALLLGGWTAWEWLIDRHIPTRMIQNAAASLALGGGFLLYQYVAILSDPLLLKWNQQNVTLAPPIWDFILSLSPALLLAGLAIWAFIHNAAGERGMRLLVVWVVAGIVLVYLPFALQRRFLTGYYVPLAGLAAVGLAFLNQRWPKRERLAWRITLVVSGLSNLLVLLIGLFGILAHAPELYLNRDESAALQWLRENSPKEAVVLAGADMGLYIPAQTGRRVIYGHPFETVNADLEQQNLNAIYTGKMTGEELKEFVKKREIRYIFYSEREQVLGGNPGFLNDPIVFQQGNVRVFAAGEIP